MNVGMDVGCECVFQVGDGIEGSLRRRCLFRIPIYQGWYTPGWLDFLI